MVRADRMGGSGGGVGWWSLTGGCNDGERENWEWGRVQIHD